MRRTMAAAATVCVLLVAAACGDAGDDVAGPLGTSASTTAPRPGSTTTTTEGTEDGPGGSDEPGDPGGEGGSGGSDEPGGSGDDECQTPIWAFAPRAKARTQQPEDCPSSDEPRLGTGDVQVTLRWSSSADLDLHVTEPDGTEIWYGDKGPTSTGGQLDVDSNVGCEENGSVENVFWPEGRMPLGHYQVEVVGYSVDGCGGGEYTLVAKVEGRPVLEETGSVAEDETDTYEFDA